MQGMAKEPAPFNLTVYKGSKNTILSRSMTLFLLYHTIARAFKEWLADTSVPDESYYATMIRVRFNRRTGEVRQDKRYESGTNCRANENVVTVALQNTVTLIHAFGQSRKGEGSLPS
jgi:hypothetical protein